MQPALICVDGPKPVLNAEGHFIEKGGDTMNKAGLVLCFAALFAVGYAVARVLEFAQSL